MMGRSSKDKSQTPGLTKKDKDLWDHVTQDVNRYADSMVFLDDELFKVEITKAPTPKQKKQSKAVFVQKVKSPPTPKTPALDHYSQPGLDKRTANRLKRGQMPIDGKLDLHGRTQRQAHQDLIRFIETGYAMGNRCLLIITGKGLGPDGSVGVLRANVPRWLNEAPLRSKVLSFTYARRDHGGEGALYVLLKRQRET